MPGVSNQRLNCCVGGHPYPIHRGEENKKGKKKEKRKRHCQSCLSLNTPRRRGLSVYTQHVCLNLNKNLISRESSTFHAWGSQTPSLEGTGTREEVISSLEEDCCCFELKRPEVTHLGSQNQPLISFSLQKSSEARETTFLESTEL